MSSKYLANAFVSLISIVAIIFIFQNIGKQLADSIYLTSGNLAQVSSTLNQGNGLLGEYFSGKEFNTLALSKIDPSINFNWGDGHPNEKMPANYFSIRWTGYIEPKYSEQYTFWTQSDDGVKLWVNGGKIIDNWSIHSSTENHGSQQLIAGQKYPIKMEYYENEGLTTAKLSWSSPSQPKQIIPQSQLYATLPVTTPTPAPSPSPSPSPEPTLPTPQPTTPEVPVHLTPPPSSPSPTLSLSASPTSIASGQSSTLSWSSTNATSCTASGGWTGSKTTSGTQTVSPTSSTLYTLICTGAGGSTNQSTTISVSTVVQPPISTKFIIGDNVQTTSIINVRSAANGTLLGNQASGSTGTVVGGPIYAGGYYWWNINYVSGVDGWGAEDFMVKAVSFVPAPPVGFSGDLVLFPDKNVEFIIGPQVKANSSSSPWPWHDQNMITKGLEHGNNFPASPSLEPIDNDTYLNRNYYDLGLSLYTAYYRTGDQQFLTLARKVTDSWWQHNLIANGTRTPSESMTPRSVALGGLMLRALDGRPEMWPWIESYVRWHHWVWVERFLSYSALRGGVRDEGYMLLYASLLAEVHPDPVIRDEFKAKAIKSSKDYFARLQNTDGGWYWLIDTDWNSTTPDIKASQPFQVGILMEGMIKMHQITGDDTLKQSITKAADWLYAKSYETQPTTNLPSVLWRAMRYFTIESDYTSNNRTSAFLYGSSDGGIRDARELNPTTIHTFGYAYKLTGDPKYRQWGDEVFAATFGKNQGPGADKYTGLADFRGKEFNQNYRSASRYLVWRLSPSGLTPTPTPTTTPTPIPTPTSGKFIIGDNVQTTSVLNVRSTANGTLLGTQTLGALGTITAGPVYAGGYYWWNINYASGVDGWGAEDFLEKQIIINPPTLPLPTSYTPPELPRMYVDTTMPTQTGQTINVNAGNNLQTAINNAQPGDTIVLQAGATFSGKLSLPNKTNPNNKWIIIKTSAENNLPPQGQRVQLTHAQFMPKIVTTNVESAIKADQGANYYRFIGIEVTDNGQSNSYGPDLPGGGKGNLNYGLVSLGSLGRDTQLNQLPHHIVFDRSYIHGQPTTHVKYGISMDGMHLAVVDSYISDIHGVGQDTQAIRGLNGLGPFKIVNSHLEAAGENILFGGADPSIPNLIPSDIEIRNNYIYKPLTWKENDPSFAGINWLNKNLFETKNIQRMIFEGNVLENSWADGQSGYGFVMKSSNQDGRCPWCVSQDLTIRNNVMRNTGNGVSIHGLDAYSGGGGISQRRVLFEQNLFENVGYRLFQITEGAGGPQQDITIRKNTVWSDDPGSYPAAFVLDGGGKVVERLTIEDNVLVPGLSGRAILGSGIAAGIPSLNRYTDGWTVLGNSFVAQNDSVSNSIPNNVYTTRVNGGFVNYTTGNFALSSNSPLKGTATGGGDPGANIPVVLNATRGAVTGMWK